MGRGTMSIMGRGTMSSMVKGDEYYGGGGQ